MTRLRSMALVALGGLGLWGSSAAAQYVGGGTAYAPGYYYASRPAAGFYHYAAPAPYYVAPSPSSGSSVLVPSGSIGRNDPVAPGPLHNYGLEPESLRPRSRRISLRPPLRPGRARPGARAGGGDKPGGGPRGTGKGLEEAAREAFESMKWDVQEAHARRR